ncbi:uncharacterized protein LOC62_03G005148 [Vanrija pseudolonga]|uniref:Uncharacterized protein n=1 Tax=Vanrija pseudolonga TaxID=143232 RepID=A0AAF0Y7S7_9TREE|nr:hypothetical protein LOC62_03G005148 [Vanrija pseudolonga]
MAMVRSTSWGSHPDIDWSVDHSDDEEWEEEVDCEGENDNGAIREYFVIYGPEKHHLAECILYYLSKKLDDIMDDLELHVDIHTTGHIKSDRECVALWREQENTSFLEAQMDAFAVSVRTMYNNATTGEERVVFHQFCSWGRMWHEVVYPYGAPEWPRFPLLNMEAVIITASKEYSKMVYSSLSAAVEGLAQTTSPGASTPTANNRFAALRDLGVGVGVTSPPSLRKGKHQRAHSLGRLSLQEFFNTDDETLANSVPSTPKSELNGRAAPFSPKHLRSASTSVVSPSISQVSSPDPRLSTNVGRAQNAKTMKGTLHRRVRSEYYQKSPMGDITNSADTPSTGTPSKDTCPKDTDMVKPSATVSADQLEITKRRKANDGHRRSLSEHYKSPPPTGYTSVIQGATKLKHKRHASVRFNIPPIDENVDGFGADPAPSSPPRQARGASTPPKNTTASPISVPVGKTQGLRVDVAKANHERSTDLAIEIESVADTVAEKGPASPLTGHGMLLPAAMPSVKPEVQSHLSVPYNMGIATALGVNTLNINDNGITGTQQAFGQPSVHPPPGRHNVPQAHAVIAPRFGQASVVRQPYGPPNNIVEIDRKNFEARAYYPLAAPKAPVGSYVAPYAGPYMWQNESALNLSPPVLPAPNHGVGNKSFDNPDHVPSAVTKPPAGPYVALYPSSRVWQYQPGTSHSASVQATPQGSTQSKVQTQATPKSYFTEETWKMPASGPCTFPLFPPGHKAPTGPIIDLTPIERLVLKLTEESASIEKFMEDVFIFGDKLRFRYYFESDEPNYRLHGLVNTLDFSVRNLIGMVEECDKLLGSTSVPFPAISPEIRWSKHADMLLHGAEETARQLEARSASLRFRMEGLVTLVKAWIQQQTYTGQPSSCIMKETSFDSDTSSSELSGTVVDTPSQEDFDLSIVTDGSSNEDSPYRQRNSFEPDEETFKQMMAEAKVYTSEMYTPPRHPLPSRARESCDTLETFYRANPVTENPPTPAKTKPWTPLRVRKRTSAPELGQKRSSLIVRNVERHTSLQLHQPTNWEIYAGDSPTPTPSEADKETTQLDLSVLRMSPPDDRVKPYLTRYNLNVAVIIKYHDVVVFINDVRNFKTAVRFRVWKCTSCRKSDTALIRELDEASHFACVNIKRFIFRLEVPLETDFEVVLPNKKMTLAKLFRFDTSRAAEELSTNSQALCASIRKLHGEICELLEGEGAQTQ